METQRLQDELALNMRERVSDQLRDTCPLDGGEPEQRSRLDGRSLQRATISSVSLASTPPYSPGNDAPVPAAKVTQRG
jgi:hypothetical protein